MRHSPTRAGRLPFPHELSSGCNVRPSGCTMPKESEKVRDEGMLPSPGDVISTGTPRTVVLRDGDVLECHIEGFEPLKNPVRRY